MQELSRGTLHKMHIALGDPVAEYQLNLGNQTIAMNELIGKQLKLTHLGEIHCIHCQRKTKKVLPKVIAGHALRLYRNAIPAL